MSDSFQKTVWSYYKKHGRDLPWRPASHKATQDKNFPYKILVSEVMLQQTQVDRVLPKYKTFLKSFPSFGSLANAKTADVIRAWQGLGYNRRALSLKRAAEIVMREYHGKLPRDFGTLVALPGVGSYTAGALLTFIWNEPMVFIETNIRTVYLHEFFKNRKNISDTTIENKIAETLDAKNPREWYYALMDYGAHLKKTLGNQNKRSKHYTKQSTFKGSPRELRGKILKLLAEKSRTEKQIARETKRSQTETRRALNALAAEGFIKKSRTHYTLG